MGRIGRPAKQRDRYLGLVLELAREDKSIQGICDFIHDRDQVRLPKSTVARWLQEAKSKPPVPASKVARAGEASGRLREIATDVAIGDDARPFLDGLLIAVDDLLEQGREDEQPLTDRTASTLGAGDLCLAALELLATRYKGERVR